MFVTFFKEHFERVRLHCNDLTRKELDMLGISYCVESTILQLVILDPHTNDAKHRHKDRERRRRVVNFFHHGHKVCGNTFRMLHGMGKYSQWQKTIKLMIQHR